MASCVAAAAVALAAPQRLASTASSAISAGKKAKAPNIALPQGPGALPPSLSASVQVMVELDAPPAVALYSEAYQAAQAEASKQMVGKIPLASAQKGALPKIEVDAAITSRVKNQVATIDAAQRSLLPSIANAGASVIYRTQRVYNGIAVRVSPDKVADLAKMPGVKAVRAMVPKYPTAFNDIDFLGTRTPWSKPLANGNTGLHGEGVKVAVIDTGVDYVHTNFGGPGTAEAYAVSEDKDPVPNAYFPTAKLPFGYDFAGDNYDANEDDDAHQPSPDPNPMDTNTHGTACASVVGGFGVNFGGSRYQGNYDAAAPNVGAMKISPGFAPQAQIIPLRVFGTNGSTNLTTEAIEYAMDPNGDGNFNDHVDIISMSLGSNNGTPDDDSAVASSNAVAAGVVVICSAGNAADSYYITGSPGSATGAIATAASFNDQAGFIADAGIIVNRPANIAGSRATAVYGNPCPKAPAQGLNGDVVEARPRTGSNVPSGNPYDPTPLTNAPFAAGKIVLVDRGVSSFYQKAVACQNSGAIGVIISNQNNPGQDPIVAGLTPAAGGPPITIPVVMVNSNDADALRRSAQFDATTGVSNAPSGTNVTIYNDNQVISRGGGAGDTMTTYSSRGPQIATNALKPDLTAPGEVVGVASAQTGTGAQLHNGTSSACPHVSGGMALMKQLHPTWSVQELNALMMNTANHDLFTTTAKTTRHGVSRVGAGRVDFDLASKSDVVVFNSSDPATVSVSFGSVEVPVDGSVALTKNVTIRNKGTTDVTYNGAVQMVNTVGDANFSAPSAQFLVRAGQEVTFPLLFRATGSTLRKTRDPSVSNGQGVANTTLSRDWLAEAAGYGVLTPTTAGLAPIRIPLYANPKPASSMHASTTVFNPNGNTGTFNIPLSGAGIAATDVSVNAGRIISLVKALELQYVSPDAGNGNAPSDSEHVKYVGVTSDYSAYSASQKVNTTLTFGIETFGNTSVPSFVSSDRQVLIDLNFDGIPEFQLYLDSVRLTGSNPPTHSNVYYSALVNLNTGSGVYEYPTNGLQPIQADTNSFNNSSVLMSVDAKDLTYTGSGQSNFDYWVETYDRLTGALQERTPTMHYDIARPGFDTANGNLEPFLNTDFPGQGGITVSYNGANAQANQSKGVLLIHRHNALGNRTDVVTMRSPVITSFTPDHGPVGTTVTLQGRDFDANTQVRFSPNVPARMQLLSSNTIQTEVPPGAVTGPITVSDAFGASASSQSFTVTPPPEPSPSPSASPIESPHGKVPISVKWQKPVTIQR